MESEKTHILHELYVFSEWKPEPDFIQKSENLLPWSLHAFLKWIPFMGPEKSMLDNVSHHKEHHQRWQIALGDEGKVIAILTDNILEVRSKRSDYSTIAARTSVARDPNPQWRQLVWSPDCSFLALAHSNGNVAFYDLTASNVFNIPADCSRPGGLECTGNTHALSAVVFVPLRVKDIKWTWEVLLISYDGKLRGFLLSPTDDGASLHHSFHFAGGVSAALFSSAHNLLIVAGLPRRLGKESNTAVDFGVSAWRILNDDPFYKLSVASDELDALMGTDRIQYYISYIASKNISIVVSMVMSPDSTKVVCVHTNGEVTIWRLPLLKLMHRWRLPDQPEYNLNSPLVTMDVKITNRDSIFTPADVNWWSNEEIIISRFSGAVTICNINDMVNILGKNIEFLQGAPQITGAYNNTFLALECESSVISANQLRNVESTEPPIENEDEKETIVEVSKELIKSLLYAITDIEHFQPKPKKITVVSRIYRLLGIKSTTPMDLFLRKIEGGKYEEALKLADSFRLDSDLVYQQQWRKNPVSCDAIYNYLAKVSKKIWVVHQCVDRLPETMTAAKDLLNFGLKLTNTEILEEVNKCKEDNPIESPDDIVLEDLNAHTSEMLRCRHVMLFYAERLELYESILKSEKSTYLRDEYHRLRSNSLVHSCIELAKEGRIAALSCLWRQLGSLALQLTVLEHVPETVDPQLYAHLLPAQLALALAPLHPSAHRDAPHQRDWCRKDIFRSIWSSTWSEDSSPDGGGGGCGGGAEEVGAWCERRARQIEQRSGVASHALALATLAARRGARGLDRLLFHLRTLDVLLYDVNVEDVTLSELEHMSPLQTTALLMSASTPETFVRDLKDLAMPYLQRYEILSNIKGMCLIGLCNFLEALSVTDLSHILLVLKSPVEYELEARTRLDLAERCLLAHSTTEQLDKACDVLSTILKESDGSIAPSELLRRLNDLEKLINACNTLSCHDIHITLSELKDMQNDTNKVQMVLTKMARSTSTRAEPPLQQDWENLLSDILELQEIFFTCLDDNVCYEVYASALLTSGNLPSIKLAAGVMVCEATETATGAQQVPYARATKLVLNAAQEYFNSASSLDDPCLELAHACLNLITDENDEIQRELDLISSLSILKSFGLTMLPVQVRLCGDRMSLIEECLALDANAYQYSHKLLTLAKLLRVAGEDEQKREGMVLQRVAESGVRAGGGGGAVAEAARRLAALRHAAAAPLLAHVAAQPHADRELRRLLLDAALTHTDPAAIEDMLRARLALELEGVERQLGEKLEALREGASTPPPPPPLAAQDTFDSTDEDFADAVQTPVVENKSLLATIVEENKTKIGNLFVEHIWKHKFTFGATEESAVDANEEEEETRYRVHCHEFYSQLYPEYSVSDAFYRYDRFATPGSTHTLDAQAEMAQAFLRWFYVSDSLQKITPEGLECQVLQQCGEACACCDSAAGVACVVRACAVGGVRRAPSAAPQRSDAAVSFLLYALLLHYNLLAIRDEVFLTRPIQLGRLTMGDTEPPHPRRYIPEEQVQLIVACLNRLLAACECSKLTSFGLAVSASLYNNDPDYLEQTIYRLARSTDPEHIEYACTLAKKYDISAVKVWVQHISALVLKSRGMPASEINSRLSNEPMLQVLHANNEEAIACIKEEIWDQIPGDDHAALILYFTLLKNVDDKAPLAALVPTEHIKLLKKVKAASSDLNYKILLKQPNAEELTQHLMQILRAENIGLVTKLLRAVPASFKLPLSVSTIYTAWLTQHFFSVGSSATSKKWMQQYRQCASYFNKLSKEDLLTFIKNTCFTVKAIERVPAGTRNLMIMQAVDYCQQEQENEFKSSSKSEPAWSELGQELTRWARFLDNFHSSSVQVIFEKDDPTNTRKWVELEQSRGDPTEARNVLAALVLEGGLRPHALTTLLQCLHIDISIDELFRYIVDHLIDNAVKMQNLVSCLITYEKGQVRLSDDLLEYAASRATELALPPHHQISLLSLSQKKHTCSEGDMSKITQFSLELLKSEWSETDLINNLSEEDLQTEQGRRETFLKCLREANSWKKKKALVDVILCWPDFNQLSDLKSPCYQFTELLLSDQENRTENCVLLKLLMRRPVLSSEEAKLLAENAEEGAIINVLWMIILTKNQDLYEMIPSLLQTEKHKKQPINLSNELIEKLLDGGLFIKLVSSTAYQPILLYIMSFEPEPDAKNTYSVSWAISELTKANYLAEADMALANSSAEDEVHEREEGRAASEKDAEGASTSRDTAAAAATAADALRRCVRVVSTATLAY